MRITVNGEAYEAEDGATLTALLDAYGVTGGRVAVTMNDEVIPRARRGERTVSEGDQVEILTFAGGG